MINAIKNRRANRDFTNEPVAEEKIQELLKASSFAPSANAKYPWELVIIKEQTTKDLLSKTTPWATFANTAPVVIAVVGLEADSKEWIEDCAIAAEHIWLEAAEQNLGCCWIQIRGHNNAEKNVKEILNIPEDRRVLCLLAIGLGAKRLSPHDESDIDRAKFKMEKYK